MNGAASEARYLFEIIGATFELLVVDFAANERVSFPFQVNLSLASEDEIDFDDTVGREGLLTILGEAVDRYFHGVVNQFKQTGTRGRFYLYEANIVPRLWLLSMEHDCRILQNKSAGENKKVEEIVTQILEDGGITSDHFAFRLQHRDQYEVREFCVQYRETDLNFVSRLLEGEGIFYFFEHADDKHLLVFGDSTVNYQPIAGEANVLFHVTDQMASEEESVYDFSFSREIHTGKASVRDFSFEKPTLVITGQHQDDDFQRLESYDYTGRHPDTKDAEQESAERKAQIRLQEAVVYKDRAEGQSFCSRFIPGFTFTLTGHERESLNQEYLLVEVVHTGSQPQVLEEQAGTDLGTQYSNQFLAIPSSVTIRPERKTPKPVVEGVQTAIVVGPTNEEIYTDDDGYGRVKVKFHWDRRDIEGEENRSCWLRVGQFWAGKGWGSVFLPRVGDEVLVNFLEGDPDSPIVVGSVYNEANKPLYTLPDEKTKSTIKTKTYPNDPGFNEIRFEDKKGEEQVFIHAQKDMSEVVENNQSISVGANQSVSVGANQSVSVGNDRTTTVKKGDDKLTVETGDRIINIDTGDHSVTVKTGDRIVDVNTGDDKLNVKTGKKTAEIKGPYEVTVYSQYFKIKCGGSSLVLNHNGRIEIEGSDIQLKAGAHIKIEAANINSEAKSSHNTKGSLVKSDGTTVNIVKGGIVQLNP